MTLFQQKLMQADIREGLPSPEMLEVYCQYYCETATTDKYPKILFKVIANSQLNRGDYTALFMHKMSLLGW